MFENELFRVVLRSFRPTDTPSEIQLRVKDALRYFEEAFKSAFFKESILNFNNSNDGFIKKYSLNLDNKGVFFRLMNALEKTGNIEPQVADLSLHIISDRSPNNTIGFTREFLPTIFTYQQFIDKADPTCLTLPRLSAHFAHEWTHLLGFGHPENPNSSNKHITSRTVPFVVQEIVELYVANREMDFNFIGIA